MLDTQDKQLMFSAMALILQKLQTASVQADERTREMIDRLKEAGDASERKGWNIEVAAVVVEHLR